MKNIETKWLYDFLTLESFRHFSQAAEQRNLSQPAFSRRIQALENAIGVTLFDRTTSPLQLTEQGKLFHSQARSLLQQFECNLSELAGHSQYSLPNIKIAAAHSLSLTLLPDLLLSLSSHSQEFVYHVEAIDVVQVVYTLHEGKSDFILSFNDDDLLQAPFKHLKVFESELYPVCATNAQGEALFDIYQADFPLLNYTPNSYMGLLVNRCLAYEESFAPQTLFMSSMSELLKNMAIKGHGIAWLPHYSISEELAQNRLVCLGEDKHKIPIQAYIYRMNTRLNKIAEHFWDMLEQQVTPRT